LVGRRVVVGTGRRRPGDLLAILRATDRARAGDLAPPNGLSLWEVGY
jgi:tRNA pseudouridine38-40 synthase